MSLNQLCPAANRAKLLSSACQDVPLRGPVLQLLHCPPEHTWPGGDGGQHSSFPCGSLNTVFMPRLYTFWKAGPPPSALTALPLLCAGGRVVCGLSLRPLGQRGPAAPPPTSAGPPRRPAHSPGGRASLASPHGLSGKGRSLRCYRFCSDFAKNVPINI